mgnify:CR=1 FL=1
MAEYIERETAVRAVMAAKWVDGSDGAMAMEIVASPAAADVAPVVRCKDCKHLCVWNRKDIYAFCPKTNIVFLPFEKDTRTFFCGFGERKDGGAE